MAWCSQTWCWRLKLSSPILPQAAGRREQVPVPPVPCFSGPFNDIAGKDEMRPRSWIVPWSRRVGGSGFLPPTAVGKMARSTEHQAELCTSMCCLTSCTWKAFRNCSKCRALSARILASIICVIPKGVWKLVHIQQDWGRVARFIHAAGWETCVISHINLSDVWLSAVLVLIIQFQNKALEFNRRDSSYVNKQTVWSYR